ncbi:MAG TPA: DUF805 domain-containing protein [Rhizomicrobium sp.]|nr:DUF805 domain-containing protein [Rhizomicrobium sp.]
MDNLDFNKLWQNWLDTITKHYVDFNGRVDRMQFWYFVLVNVLIALAVAIVASIIWAPALSRLYSLAVLLPSMGMGVRRLHDTGKPGIWILIGFIPWGLILVFGMFMLMGGMFGMMAILFVLMPILGLASLAAACVLIYLWIQPGQPEANQYGPVPPVFEPGAPKPAV